MTQDLSLDIDPFDVDERVALDLARGTFLVPPFPLVALRCAEAAAAGLSASEIGRIVSADPALAADLLRAANCAAQMVRPVESLAEAVSRLGELHIQRLCLVASLASHSVGDGPLAALRRRLWHESLASALICEALAKVRSQPTAPAYLAGLLHDFGKIVTLGFIERALHGADELASAEPYWLHVVERHHVHAGDCIADSWRLPESIRQAIVAHHRDPEDGEPPLLAIVRVTDLLVRQLGTGVKLDADDICAVDGIRGDSEVLAVLRGLAALPPLLQALRSAIPPSRVAAPAHTPVTGKPVAIMARTLGRASVTGMVASTISRVGVTLQSPLPFQPGWVTNLELAAPGGTLRVWVTILSCSEAAHGHVVEAKPLCLAGTLKDAWFRFVDRSAAAAQSSTLACHGVPRSMDVEAHQNAENTIRAIR